MSGHSHFATIKRQKEAKDSKKGKMFSKHAKAIQIAIKQGGGADPELNSRLRFTIDQAKSDNVPKTNIDRILSKAGEIGDIEEVVYEGYGPDGIAVMILCATDNKNRTVQEIKNIIERSGGSLASPGSVTFNFEKKGFFVVERQGNVDEQILNLIDLGVDDVEESEDGIEVYTNPSNFVEIREKIKNMGFKINRMQITQKPKNYQMVNDPDKAKKIFHLLESLDDHEDVQEVYSNCDITPELVKTLSL